VGSLAAAGRIARLSCTLITVPANRLLAEVHNGKQRMPAILAESEHEAWLSGAPPDARLALKATPRKLMVAWKVSRRVNSPKLPNDCDPDRARLECEVRHSSRPVQGRGWVIHIDRWHSFAPCVRSMNNEECL